MFIAAAIQQNRSQYFTLLIVGASHLLALYLIWQTRTELAIAVPSRENSMQVRFIDLNKTQEVEKSSAAHSQVNKTTEQYQQGKSQQKTVENNKTDHVAIIQATQSTKTVVASQSKAKTADKSAKNDVQSNQNRQSTQDKAQQSNDQTQQNSQQQTQTSSNLANSGTAQNKNDDASSSRQGQDSKQEQNTAALEKTAAPIPVSRVDVLSLGKFSYDDHELQNQQRLIILTLQIDAKGQATAVRIKQSSGIASLDDRAVKAMHKSKFKPHKVNGEAVAIVVDFPFQLKLGRNR